MSQKAVDPRSSLRGRDVREALRGERPVKSAPVASEPSRRRQFLILGLICGSLALVCLYLLVTHR